MDWLPVLIVSLLLAGFVTAYYFAYRWEARNNPRGMKDAREVIIAIFSRIFSIFK